MKKLNDIHRSLLFYTKLNETGRRKGKKFLFRLETSLASDGFVTIK
ncbi:hypothetical protein SEHO0A_00730 [Salmonella enterica subsp. houtenae str. ATCC BAA-1581]|nr:hypothetical protein SEHO0A_00730 [Salmonella enterica subsp. houtenae str. ATCC BAA-1581]